jgi:thioesterase domain-containing protein
MDALGRLGVFAPRFDRPSELGGARTLVQLGRGGATPRMVCLPALLGSAGPHQFVDFAAGMRDVWDAAVLPHPGFIAGEPFAASVDVLARAQAETVRNGTRGAPFVLVGYSSGGWVGHAVAEMLEASGVFPDAVVLLDTYLPHGLLTGELWPEMLARMARGDEPAGVAEETSLAATAVHMSMFAGWRPGPLVAPTLLVTAAERPASRGPDGPGARAHRPAHDATVEVPGNHFSIMAEHAGSTARAVRRWLTELGVD